MQNVWHGYCKLLKCPDTRLSYACVVAYYNLIFSYTSFLCCIAKRKELKFLSFLVMRASICDTPYCGRVWMISYFHLKVCIGGVVSAGVSVCTNFLGCTWMEWPHWYLGTTDVTCGLGLGLLIWVVQGFTCLQPLVGGGFVGQGFPNCCSDWWHFVSRGDDVSS